MFYRNTWARGCIRLARESFSTRMCVCMRRNVLRQTNDAMRVSLAVMILKDVFEHQVLFGNPAAERLDSLIKEKLSVTEKCYQRLA
jgi:hypothetical protein